MGSSAKKKSQKRADFKKPKLRVGKARPKPDNLTDTSFKSKTITLATQSLTLTSPTPTAQFTHAASLLTSRNPTQRSDSLAHLTSTLSTTTTTSSSPPIPLSVLFPKLAPLLLDPSNAVRAQLLKLLYQLGNNRGGGGKRGRREGEEENEGEKEDVGPYMGTLLLYIRTALTHLSPEIRATGLEALAWAVETAGGDVVGCPGGWVKTLKVLLLLLGWEVVGGEDATAATATVGAAGATAGKWTGSKAGATGVMGGQKGNSTARTIAVLAAFVGKGIVDEEEEKVGVEIGEGEMGKRWAFPLRNTSAHMLPQRRPNASSSSSSSSFAHLNLFGKARDEEGEMYAGVEERRGVFVRRGYWAAVVRGVERCRREGGEVGRVGAGLGKVVGKGMEGWEGGAVR